MDLDAVLFQSVGLHLLEHGGLDLVDLDVLLVQGDQSGQVIVAHGPIFGAGDQVAEVGLRQGGIPHAGVVPQGVGDAPDGVGLHDDIFLVMGQGLQVAGVQIPLPGVLDLHVLKGPGQAQVHPCLGHLRPDRAEPGHHRVLPLVYLEHKAKEADDGRPDQGEHPLDDAVPFHIMSPPHPALRRSPPASPLSVSPPPAPRRRLRRQGR